MMHALWHICGQTLANDQTWMENQLWCQSFNMIIKNIYVLLSLTCVCVYILSVSDFFACCGACCMVRVSAWLFLLVCRCGGRKQRRCRTGTVRRACLGHTEEIEAAGESRNHALSAIDVLWYMILLNFGSVIDSWRLPRVNPSLCMYIYPLPPPLPPEIGLMC